MESLIKLIEGPLGASIMVLSGIVVILCCNFWLAIKAFSVKWWWGAVVFFVPFGAIVFACAHWQTAKKPIVTGILFFILASGMFILRSLVATFLT